MHEFEDRSDVTITPDLPYFSRVAFDKRGNAISSFVLLNMFWHTKDHPDTAKIMLDGDVVRDLTPEEKLAPCYPFIPKDSSLSAETYILLQPFAASHPSEECPLSLLILELRPPLEVTLLWMMKTEVTEVFLRMKKKSKQSIYPK